MAEWHRNQRLPRRKSRANGSKWPATGFMFFAACGLTLPTRLAVATGRFEVDYEHGEWHKNGPKTCRFVPAIASRLRVPWTECTCELFDLS